MTRMSEASILNKVKEILEIIQEFSDWSNRRRYNTLGISTWIATRGVIVVWQMEIYR